MHFASNLHHETISDNTKNVKYIIHLADIHISNNRYNEYSEAFDKLFDMLRIYPKDETIICVVGDILDNSDTLGEITVKLFGKFVKGLNSLGSKILFLYGNHDCIRADTTDGILDATCTHLLNYPNIYNITKTGTYKYGSNLLFCCSTMDQENKFIQYGDIEHLVENRTTIYLFHGIIGGSVLYNGYVNRTTQSAKYLEKYDYALLGDIHKHQSLNAKKTQWYCGSLLEQNLSEINSPHGFMVHDLVEKTSKHIILPSDYKIVPISVVNGIVKPHNELPPHADVRLFISNTDIETLDRIESELEKKCKTLKIKHTYITNKENQMSDPDSSKSFIELCYDHIENHKGLDSSEKAILLNKFKTDAVKADRIENTVSPYKFLRLKFSNLFCYGPDNLVDFTLMKGPNSIVGPNGYGKSTLIQLILFAMYSKSPQSGSNHKEMVLHHGETNAKTFGVELYIEMGGYIYIIKRSGSLAGSKVTLTVTLHKYAKGTTGIINISGGGTKPTDAKIANLFGSYDKMVATSFMSQDNTSNMSCLDGTDRFKLFQSIYGLEDMDDLQRSVRSLQLEKIEIVNDLVSKMHREELIDGDTKKDLSLTKTPTKPISLNKYEREKTLNKCYTTKDEEQKKLIEKKITEENKYTSNVSDVIQIYTLSQRIIGSVQTLLDNSEGKLSSVTIDNYLEQIKQFAGSDQKLQAIYTSLYEQTRDLTKQIDTTQLLDIKTIIGYAEYESKHKILIEQINKLEEQKSKLVNARNQLKAADSQLKIYDVYYHMLTNDIPKLLVSRFFPRIEEIANQVINTVSPLKIKFDVDTGEGNKHFDVVVQLSDKVHENIEQLSGGQKVIVNLGVRIALTLCGSGSARSMFLDECFVSLDREKVTKLGGLFDMLNKHFDFVLVISHLEPIQQLMLKSFEIERAKYHSKINLLDQTASYIEPDIFTETKYEAPDYSEMSFGVSFGDPELEMPKKQKKKRTKQNMSDEISMSTTNDTSDIISKNTMGEVLSIEPVKVNNPELPIINEPIKPDVLVISDSIEQPKTDVSKPKTVRKKGKVSIQPETVLVEQAKVNTEPIETIEQVIEPVKKKPGRPKKVSAVATC